MLGWSSAAVMRHAMTASCRRVWADAICCVIPAIRLAGFSQALMEGDDVLSMFQSDLRERDAREKAAKTLPKIRQISLRLIRKLMRIMFH